MLAAAGQAAACLRTGNRVTSATHTSNGTDQYAYDPANRRVWKNTPQGQRTHFYGVDGTRMGSYGGGSGGPFNGDWDNVNVYFAGEQVWQEEVGGTVAVWCWTGWGQWCRGTTRARSTFRTARRR